MGDGGATFHEVKPVDSARSKAGMKSEGDCLLRGLGRGCGGSGQTVAVLSGRQATCRSEAGDWPCGNDVTSATASARLSSPVGSVPVTPCTRRPFSTTAASDLSNITL